MNNRTDILVLEENNIGEDYIIADLHGNAACLEGALAQLNHGDRLFIAGDLTDRGAESARVVELIMTYQKNHPDSLYVVQGNHESNNLDCIQSLADCFDDLNKIPYSPTDDSKLQEYAAYFTSKEPNTFKGQMHDIQFCLLGGGYWLLQLFRHEMMTNDLHLKENDALGSTKKSFIKKYFYFVSELPYIIYVKGKRPFTVVHAHMPFTHKTMLERLQLGITELSDNEKYDAMNLRISEFPNFLKQFSCDEFIMPTYAGHTVINGIHLFPWHEHSKTLVADVWACQSGIILMINHTKFTCQYVGPNVFAIALMEANYEEILKQVQNYLQNEKNKYHALTDENDASASPQRNGNKRERLGEGTLFHTTNLKKGKLEPRKLDTGDSTPTDSAIKRFE